MIRQLVSIAAGLGTQFAQTQSLHHTVSPEGGAELLSVQTVGSGEQGTRWSLLFASSRSEGEG